MPIRAAEASSSRMALRCGWDDEVFSTRGRTVFKNTQRHRERQFDVHARLSEQGLSGLPRIGFALLDRVFNEITSRVA